METDFAATDAFLCTVLDKTAWENMQKPAYTDIHGEYPTKENEIHAAHAGSEAAWG